MDGRITKPEADMPLTPAEALGPTVRETVVVAGRSFVIARPDAVDRLIDHPLLGAVTAADEYMPYWAHLWPAARMLAEAVLQEPWPDGPLLALEVGCGLGLPGVAALASGMNVIFSDYDATSLRYAADNARMNGFSRFQLLPMDYRSPPADLQVPVMLASDPIYESHMAAPLAALIRRVLAPDGLCLLTEQDRLSPGVLRDALLAERLTFSTRSMTGMDSDGRKVAGTLYRIHGRIDN